MDYKWQPINTAPKDGTEILVVYMKQGGVMELVFWNKMYKYWVSKGELCLGLETNATHWIPLPELPTNEE